MDFPVANFVETVDLKSQDVLLPLFEAVVNSIISLKQTPIPEKEKLIKVQIHRGDVAGVQSLVDSPKPITSISVIDNGNGFNPKNYKSYKTAYTNINRKFGCKGIGRFTILAAYKDILVDSTYKENGSYANLKFRLNVENEIIEENLDSETRNEERRTVVKMRSLYNRNLIYASQIEIDVIAEGIMNHCLIYYLSGELPRIEILDVDNEKAEVVNDLYEAISKDREKSIEINGKSFRCYITKTLRESNRKNHYIYYCANSRVVGRGRNLAKVNSLFVYPIIQDNGVYFLDVFITSDYLDQNVYAARNGFKIPGQKQIQSSLNGSMSILSFEEIEEKIALLLSDEYNEYVKKTQRKSQEEIRSYITHRAPRYQRFISNEEILNKIPPGLSEDKLELALHHIAFKEQKSVEITIKDFIDKKEIDEESIEIIKEELKQKTAYDADNLADYMFHRKAVIDLFNKFLEADREGKYKLEEDIHNLIFPMGVIQEGRNIETHNLWLLDERFATYSFIASDKPITSYSQVKSRKEADLVMLDQPPMFDNPISFGSQNSGEIKSMVIFEFKRPGDTAHQKRKTDYRWEFSELIEKYFDDFIYGTTKKNYKGRTVVLDKNTPKFGYVVVDIIHPQLLEYNQGKGYRKTPFGTLYKLYPELNMHIEVVTFEKLIEGVEDRHNPFFDKLFIN